MESSIDRADLTRKKILVVDDEEHVLNLCKRLLIRAGFSVVTAKTGRGGLDIFRSEDIGLAIIDIRLPDIGGVELLKEMKKNDRNINVIMMTAYPDIQLAVESIREGAYDFLTKPFEPLERLVYTAERAIRETLLKYRKEEVERQLSSVSGMGGIIGTARAMQKVFHLIRSGAPTDATILITGESGTGKELVARAIHELSRRKERPLLTINCSSLSETLLESELFGHIKGAFTGAISTKKGLFEEANHGTIFLDEIGDMPLSIQGKILRVLQEGEVRKVGSTTTERVDVRLIAATNRDLRNLIKEGRFREDLFYRLNVLRIDIPPLRERREDILPLAFHFLERFSKKLGKSVKGFSRSAMDALLESNWEGNVRELENCIERAVILCNGETIEIEDLFSKDGKAERPKIEMGLDDLMKLSYKKAKERVVESFSRIYLQEVLKMSGGNFKEAAERTGVERSNLHKLLKRFGVKTKGG